MAKVQKFVIVGTVLLKSSHGRDVSKPCSRAIARLRVRWIVRHNGLVRRLVIKPASLRRTVSQYHASDFDRDTPQGGIDLNTYGNSDWASAINVSLDSNGDILVKHLEPWEYMR